MANAATKSAGGEVPGTEANDGCIMGPAVQFAMADSMGLPMKVAHIALSHVFENP